MELHLVVPASVDDPVRPSGGNVYDAELARAVEAHGGRAALHPVPGAWPEQGDHVALHRVLQQVPDGAAVVVDGLIGSAAPDVLAGVRERLDVLLLVHLPLGLASPALRGVERRALDAVAGVVTVSTWTQRWLASAYGLDPGRVTVARPGARRGPLARRGSGGALLCVGAVAPAKGQDVLVEALATVWDLAWTCRVVGPLDRDPGYVRTLERRIRERGLEGRVLLRGPVPHEHLTTEYAAAELLVQPTRLETFGMAVTEALGHGVPVVAADTGGVSEALGAGGAGVLVPPDDPQALGQALRDWLDEPALRERLRRAAGRRREELTGWAETARGVLDAVARARLNRSGRGSVVQA